MSDDREAILSRVRSALAPIRERAPLPRYDTDISVTRTLVAGGDLGEIFTDRIKKGNGLALTDPTALVAVNVTGYRPPHSRHIPRRRSRHRA